MGLLGNSVSAFVYSRRRMQSSLNLYLCALAFSDIIIVSTSFFLFFLESLRKRSAFISKYYALLAPIMFPLGLTAQSLSVFLTIAAAIDCFVLMTGAERVRKRCCTVRTSKLVRLRKNCRDNESLIFVKFVQQSECFFCNIFYNAVY